jgi:DNA-directed RNA polymerase specialized sigma24 family protein
VQTLDDLGKVSADDFFDELSLGMDVLATLEKLSARCRVALTLCWNDAETDDIAEALNTTPDNVYNVLHRCRKRARDIYESLTQVS